MALTTNKNLKPSWIGKYRVDGFDGTNIYQFYGCFWHGCRECFPTGGDDVNKKSYESLYNGTQTIENNLKKKYPVKTIWEHDFDNLAKVEKMPTIDESVLPLRPKDAMFGGRTETFIAYCENIQPKYYDFTSLYPTVQYYCDYPTGEKKIIQNPKVNNKHWFAFAKVTIGPKQNYIPVLPQKSGQLTFGVLRKTGTCCTNEINLALSKGDEIESIHEDWTWSERRQDIFKEYVKLCLKIKQESSGYSDWVKTEEDYRRRQGIQLDRTKIEKNPGLKFIAKLCLNSSWGNFGLSLDVDNIVYVNDEVENFKYLSSKTFKRCDNLSEKMVVMKISGKQKPNYRTIMCIAAFTTAHARIKPFDLMDKIQSSGGRVYYCDRDSVIFEGADTIETGDLLGDLTSELPHGEYIQNFASAGAKAYGYETNTGKTSMKMTFTNDKHHIVRTVYSEKKIQNALDKRIWNEDGSSAPHGWQ